MAEGHAGLAGRARSAALTLTAAAHTLAHPYTHTHTKETA